MCVCVMCVHVRVCYVCACVCVLCVCMCVCVMCVHVCACYVCVCVLCEYEGEKLISDKRDLVMWLPYGCTGKLKHYNNDPLMHRRMQM